MDRPDRLQEIAQQFAIHPVVALLGPRQCGKTTLSRMAAERSGKTVTRSMHTAIDVLELDELRIVHPGDRTFPLAQKIRAVGLTVFGKHLPSMPTEVGPSGTAPAP
jgi:predicted AAA+ superfamily ATPase